MCGICGFIEKEPFRTPGEARDILAAMNQEIFHRGPDEGGEFSRSPVHLAMRRLSIIDIASGHQPMWNDDHNLGIVFNGEIYNFLEIRERLIGQGVRFSTHSDTEVVLRLYEAKGPRALDELNGMFAIAIWDERKQELFLARDRFGKKPLYYADTPSGFGFASELKSLLKYPGLKRELNPDGLALFLSFDYIPYPESILKNVKKLPPAHYLIVKDGKIEITRYWSLDFSKSENTNSDLTQQLHDKLLSAVERRLMSEVPLGVFLSGGLDSSLITALMCKLREPSQVKTFSIHFEEKSFDESDYSNIVANHLKTDHHTHLFKSRDLLDLVPKIANSMDEPFADASIFPTMLLSRFTREHVTVALSGDGADELFAGYPTFGAARFADFYSKMPKILRRVIEKIIWALPTSTQNMSLEFKLRQFLAGQSYTGVRRQAAWLAPFPPHELRHILSDDLLKSCTFKDPFEIVDREMASSTPLDDIDETSDFYLKFYLAEGILTKTDRASMAHSLEVRAPFLDREVAEFIAKLPSNLKLKGHTTKYLLKEMARPLLPAKIIDRPKKGFGIPVAHWFRYELKDFLADHLKSPSMRESGLFKMNAIDRLLAEHWTGKCDHRKKLFPLLMFSLWRETYLAPD